MGYIAEIHLAHEDLLLQPTILTAETVTLRRQYATEPEPGTTLLYVSVSGDVPSGFESILVDDPTITEPTHIVTFGDRTIYRVRVVTELDPVPDEFTELGGYILDVMSDGDGWVVRTHLPDREALLEMREYFRARDVSFRIARLYDAEAIDRVGNAGLTEKQRDLLLTALYSGYYDIPRRASQGDLAEQLEVSTSAISQRLRRAISQLIVSSLDPEDVSEDSTST